MDRTYTTNIFDVLGGWLFATVRLPQKNGRTYIWKYYATIDARNPLYNTSYKYKLHCSPSACIIAWANVDVRNSYVVCARPCRYSSSSSHVCVCVYARYVHSICKWVRMPEGVFDVWAYHIEWEGEMNRRRVARRRRGCRTLSELSPWRTCCVWWLLLVWCLLLDTTQEVTWFVHMDFANNVATNINVDFPLPDWIRWLLEWKKYFRFDIYQSYEY